jgi:hypothetical protein
MSARAASGASSTIESMELAAGDEIRPTDVAAAAARSLLRGRTVEALARELAWAAVRAAGLAHDQIDWLVPMVDAQLTLRFEEVEAAASLAARRAYDDHLRRWPHDHPGAATGAAIRARDEADLLLGTIYLETLEWAGGLLRERFLQTPQRRRWRRSKRRATQAWSVEVPAVVVALVGERDVDGPGWPGRDAA